MDTETTGASINGINKIGFKTIGKPNITGSLILKIPGPRDKLATAR